MSSTFLTRLRIGERLVDAKGVSRLYNPSSDAGSGGALRRRLPGPADDPDHHLAGAQRRLPAGLAEDQDLARDLAVAVRPSSLRPLMGYSARYHATSLIAVFLSLAIGILIGAEFGGDALTSTRKNLEHSLVGNLQDARSRADELSGELGRANEFGDRVYPVLTREPAGGQADRDRRPRRPAQRSLRRGRGSARRRPGRSWSASASCASRSTSAASPTTSRRPASPTWQTNPESADRARARGSAASW